MGAPKSESLARNPYKPSATTMRAQILAHTVYAEGPEYPEYAMHILKLKYSGNRKCGNVFGVLLPVGLAQPTKENEPKYQTKQKCATEQDTSWYAIEGHKVKIHRIRTPLISRLGAITQLQLVTCLDGQKRAF